MASPSPSPAPSNNRSSESPATAATPNGSATPQRPATLDAPKPSGRSINKPKCINCGNVARSRCPFQCCKSCCFKAQNPCHIHVLKQNGTLPDKPPPASNPLSEQPSVEVPSASASWRLSSLRQLSSTFVHSLRARKPLTRKDAININKWRFSKLREHIEADLEAENEAFERYMKNVGLLEETFSVMEGPNLDDHSTSEATSEGNIKNLVSDILVKLKSNSKQADSFRERIQHLIDEKLRKLREPEVGIDEGTPSVDELDAHRAIKRVKRQAERNAGTNDLVDKLSKVRNEDDLQSCLELKFQLFNQTEEKGTDVLRDQHVRNHLIHKDELDSTPTSSTCPLPSPASSTYSLPTMFNIVHINQGDFSNINGEFSSLDQIAEL